MKYRLLVDIATDRIIWYTADLSATVANDQHSAIAEYDGELPTGLNLGNSWNYGYRNKQVILLNQPATVEPLLEQNRKSIRNFLIEKINAKRSAINFNLKFSEHIDLLIYNEAYQYNGLNLDSLPWLKLAVKYDSLPVEKKVEEIKFQFSEKRSTLLQTEDLFLEMSRRIDSATANEELFVIRQEIFDKLNSNN